MNAVHFILTMIRIQYKMPNDAKFPAILPPSCAVGGSCQTNIGVKHYCPAFPSNVIFGDCSEEVLPSIADKHSYQALLSLISARHCCQGSLPSTVIKHTWQTYLSKIPVKHFCQALLFLPNILNNITTNLSHLV